MRIQVGHLVKKTRKKLDNSTNENELTTPASLLPPDIASSVADDNESSKSMAVNTFGLLSTEELNINTTSKFSEETFKICKNLIIDDEVPTSSTLLEDNFEFGRNEAIIPAVNYTLENNIPFEMLETEMAAAKALLEEDI